MDYKYIKVAHEGKITIVTINRPEAFNALNRPAHIELDAAFNEFANNPQQWVAILTGEGTKAFCAGHDLKQQAAGGGLETTPSGFAGLTTRTGLSKPVIAAVNGIAMGGGFETALACDIIIATRTAAFALPEPRVGLAALAGGIQRLPKEIGLKRAMGMMLTGRKVSADEGLRLGFVNEVVDGDVLEAARRWANEILECSPMSVRATKDAVLQGLTLSVADGMNSEWDIASMKEMMASQDAVEGPAAFVEKRKPNWRGC